jgi:HPt (histidine-containing phosphotransfer) domain-containing protein
LFSALATWIKRDKAKPTLARPTGEPAVKEVVKKVPEVLPGIDMQSVLRRLNGNTALLKKLLNQFLTDHTDTFNRVKGALEDGDTKLAKRLVHTVKGVAGNLGAIRLHSAAQRLEGAISRGTSGDLDNRLAGFEEALLEMFDSAKRFQEVSEEVSAVQPQFERMPTELPTVGPLFSELALLLRTNNLRAEECVGEIKKYLRSSSVGEEIKKLEGQIDKFDYQGAENTLAGIVKILGFSSDAVEGDHD